MNLNGFKQRRQFSQKTIDRSSRQNPAGRNIALVIFARNQLPCQSDSKDGAGRRVDTASIMGEIAFPCVSGFRPSCCRCAGNISRSSSKVGAVCVEAPTRLLCRGASAMAVPNATREVPVPLQQHLNHGPVLRNLTDLHHCR
jgi:hypothetical protein